MYYFNVTAVSLFPLKYVKQLVLSSIINCFGLLIVRFFSYGPTSVERKRTHICGMVEKKKKNSCVTHPVSSQTFLALSSRPVSRDREKNRLLAVYNSFSYEDKQNIRYIHHLILNWDVLKRAKRPRLENVPRAVKQGK